MRDLLHSNESLKLQLSKSRAECITDPDVLVKLQSAEKELAELHQELDQQQQQQHEV